MTNEVVNVPELRFTGFEDEWKETNLGNIANIVGGGTPKTEIPEYWNGEINWYSPVEIGDRNYVYESKNKITQLGLQKSSAKILPIGTVLFTARAGIGNTAILKKEGATNQGFQSIIPKEGVLDTYFIFSRTNELKRYGEIHGAGSTFVEISGKEMAKMPISIPVIKEQQKIGDFFSKLDRQIELEEQKLAKLEEQKKGYMQQIFSQELRFKEDNENSYPEWESAPLFDIFTATKGKSLSKDKISNDGKYECILYGEIYTTYAEKIESIVSRTNYYEGILSQKNDLIFPNSTTTNSWDLATFSSLQKNNVLIGGDISILRTKRSDISSLFYAYYLTNYLKLRKDIAKYAQGITIVHLSFNNFYKIKVQIPSLEEQNSITDFIDSLNQQQKLIANKIKLLKERKKGFLQKMFV
ncbi:restriction endonuclease subunit S [Staphylococcus xylosus]|uniref:restriction endonuclease subunit S n=1 Tax=Staphylococcus xylosus TaxID=1288 RepID=UPI000E68021A|nr:restriction endonuclease subunit S [Staphylococcus xylosus]RIM63210.1 restriction endonuclease subunit S [Staphylococcus xylosus]